MLKPTSDVVTEPELFRDVFGCDEDDCEWHVDTRQRGYVRVCAGEWKRETDGRWRLFVYDQAEDE